MQLLGLTFESFSQVQQGQLEAGVASFEAMKDSINDMSGMKLGALSVMAPVLAMKAMVAPQSTPAPAAGSQSGTQRIRNEITITLNGRPLQTFVENTVGVVVGDALFGTS